MFFEQWRRQRHIRLKAPLKPLTIRQRYHPFRILQHWHPITDAAAAAAAPIPPQLSQSRLFQTMRHRFESGQMMMIVMMMMMTIGIVVVVGGGDGGGRR